MELAQRYQLAQEYQLYNEAKRPFIWRVIAQADGWAWSTGWSPGPSDAWASCTRLAGFFLFWGCNSQRCFYELPSWRSTWLAMRLYFSLLYNG